MTITTLLLDHDGTLVDSEVVHYRLWCQILAPYKIHFSEQDYCQHHVGISCEDNAHRLIKDYKLPAEHAALVQAKQQAVQQFQLQHGFPLINGVRTFIERMAKRFRLAVVSGSDQQAVMQSLVRHKLADYIEVVATGDEVARNKPAPDVYQLAMQRLAVQPQQCVAIEDTFNGMSAALAATVPCLVVPNRYSANHDFSSATAVLSQIGDSEDWLEQQAKFKLA